MSKVVRSPTAWTAGEVVERIRELVGHPATIRELMRVLTIPQEGRYRFRRRIMQLVEAGELIRIRGNRYGLADRMQLVVGQLLVNPRGFGFVTSEHGAEGAGKHIFVAGVNLHQAMHGDRVAVRLEREGGRPEGRIVRVLERANRDLVGRYDVDDTGVGFVLPFDRRVIMDVQIPAGATAGAGSGQMVAVEIDRWSTSTRNPIGHIVEVIGKLGDPGVDTELIIRKHRIPDAHDPAAVTEAERLGDVVARRDLRGRADFRPVLTVTIDGEAARDFDDAITLEALSNGNHWARGAHCRCGALREGGRRARRGGVRARHIGIFSRTRVAHVSGAARHRAVQSEPGCRPARAVLSDGDRSPWRGGLLRAARRRDSI